MVPDSQGSYTSVESSSSDNPHGSSMEGSTLVWQYRATNNTIGTYVRLSLLKYNFQIAQITKGLHAIGII